MMIVKMFPIVLRFLIVFIQNLFDNLDRFFIIELRIMVECFMRCVVGMGVVAMISVMVVIVVVVMMMIVIGNGASAIFTH